MNVFKNLWDKRREEMLKIVKKNGFQKGEKKSEEWKKLMSEKLKGRKITWNKKISDTKKVKYKNGELKAWNKGKKGYHTSLKWNGTRKGEDNINWKGGITPERYKIWKSEEYQNWRKLVFERDKYTCQICNKIGGNLNAHHKKSQTKYPELRFVVDNGKTLCKDCHLQTKNWGSKWQL